MLKFCDRSFWNFNINMRGRVKGQGYYSFSRRYMVGATSNFSVLPRLRARVIPVVNGSLVEVTTGVPLGSVFSATLFAVIGFGIFICNFFNDFDIGSFVLGLVFMAVPPAGMAYQNYLGRTRLLAVFAETFGLYQM